MKRQQARRQRQRRQKPQQPQRQPQRKLQQQHQHQRQATATATATAAAAATATAAARAAATATTTRYSGANSGSDSKSNSNSSCNSNSHSSSNWESSGNSNGHSNSAKTNTNNNIKRHTPAVPRGASPAAATAAAAAVAASATAAAAGGVTTLLEPQAGPSEHSWTYRPTCVCGPGKNGMPVEGRTQCKMMERTAGGVPPRVGPVLRQGARPPCPRCRLPPCGLGQVRARAQPAGLEKWPARAKRPLHQGMPHWVTPCLSLRSFGTCSRTDAIDTPALNRKARHASLQTTRIHAGNSFSRGPTPELTEGLPAGGKKAWGPAAGGRHTHGSTATGKSTRSKCCRARGRTGGWPCLRSPGRGTGGGGGPARGGGLLGSGVADKWAATQRHGRCRRQLSRRCYAVCHRGVSGPYDCGESANGRSDHALSIHLHKSAAPSSPKHVHAWSTAKGRTNNGMPCLRRGSGSRGRHRSPAPPSGPGGRGS